jgi:triacylglycerol lipase
MALVHTRPNRPAATAAALRTSATDIVRAGAYAARTFGTPAGIRGLTVEGAWLAARLAGYPAGLLRERRRVIRSVG